MNNELKLWSLIVVGIFTVIYLMVSFVVMEFNPAMWHAGARLVYVTISGIITFMSFLFSKL